jgi:4-amino-4-deoxy-L-arabinose transferase-like glycosyltransferase
MIRSDRLWLLGWCWLGAALRFRGLFANTFHADEALFAGWARHIAVWRDPLLLTQAVDKPPLLFYLQALFYPLFGPVEWAARMPALITSLLLIPLTAQLARRLTGDRAAALFAAAIMAVTPLAVQFSATAFADPLLTLWLVAALYAAAEPARPDVARRSGSLWAGLLFGLALAIKYQALLFAPLLLGVAWLGGWRRGDWWRGAAGVGAVMLAVLAWQLARPHSGGLVALQWANIGGLRLARSWELWPRFVATARLWQLSLGWPLLVAGLAAAPGLWLAYRAGRLRPVEGLLILFVLGYGLLHWLWAVPVWDRYLLPLWPLVAILLGRSFTALAALATSRPAWRRALAPVLIIFIVAQTPSAIAARDGRFPLGGGPAADGGAAAVARLLEDAPYGTVLYDHWYSWHWRYQLFDGRVYVSWFPHAGALLADLAAFGDSGPARYVVLPNGAAARPVLRRLLADGYALAAISQDETAGMTLYRIDPTRRADE